MKDIRTRLHIEALTTIVFLLLFCLTIFGLGSMNVNFANQNLERQAKELLYNFSFDVQEAQALLSSLPDVNELDCNTGISSVLVKRDFESAAVRWIGVVKDGKILCQSANVGINLTNGFAKHRLTDDWTFLATNAMDMEDSFFLVKQINGLQYLADINHLQPNAKSRYACEECTAYTLKVHGMDDLSMPRHGKLDGPVVLNQVSTSELGGATVAVDVSATQSYLDYYRHFGWLASIGIALLLSAILTFAFFWVLRERTSLEHLIVEGLRYKQFIPYYQPIVDSRTGNVLGAEALVRWRGTNGKLISPAEFVPFAEESGLILPITEQLTEKVFSDLVSFGWAGTDRYISINLVPEQLKDERYCQRLIELATSNGLEGKNVSVEITERRPFSDLENGSQILSRLVNVGIDVKLDDAGTGYGGFSYVQELPIGTLKIDKMFIDTLRSYDDAKRHVLDAIVEFSRSANLQVIAEGVESVEQVARLMSMGVFAIQGYVYAKPMERDEFIQWCSSRQVVA